MRGGGAAGGAFSTRHRGNNRAGAGLGPGVGWLGSMSPPCPGELLSPFSCVPQKAYIFTFLLSSRLFIKPQELLARVCRLCIEQQELDKPVLDKVRRGRAKQGPPSVRALPRRAFVYQPLQRQ